jgi:protein-L-isoaspartate(D-aspartate) O-methyltransferase
LLSPRVGAILAARIAAAKDASAINSLKSRGNAMADARVQRSQYAAMVAKLGAGGDKRIEAAFAAVARERHCGEGPWFVGSGDGYVRTPSDDPGFLYQNAAIGLAPERRLNNGEPGSHAVWLHQASPRPGERVVHIGAGTGYYTAILAELVGPEGQIDAYEIDPEMAERARRSLAERTNVFVHAQSGAQGALPAADLIYVNAGATAPLPVWLDALRVGGRLIFPLTPDKGIGGMLLVTRRENEPYAARFVSGAVFFPCFGARNADESARLSAAFAAGGAKDVRWLYRSANPDPPSWLSGEDWRLSR